MNKINFCLFVVVFVMYGLAQVDDDEYSVEEDDNISSIIISCHSF
jgi:hypothetical protein